MGHSLHGDDDMHGGQNRACFFGIFFHFGMLRAGTRLARFGSVICFQRGDSRCCGGGEGSGEGEDVALDCPYLRGRDSLIDDVMQLAHSLSVPDSATRRKERRQIHEMTATRFGIVVVVSSAIWGVASGC